MSRNINVYLFYVNQPMIYTFIINYTAVTLPAFVRAWHLGSNFQARCHARTCAELLFFFIYPIINKKTFVKVPQKAKTTRL